VNRFEKKSISDFLLAITFLIAATTIGMQLLYTAGQVIHFVIVVYKSGGFEPHMISFGRTGALLYLVAAAAIALGLWTFIKHRGGMKNAKLATLLLTFSLLSTITFAGLIAMPYSDVVSR